MHAFPQRSRLLARVRATAAPLLQLWGWPGSGRAPLLSALAVEPDAWVPPGADLTRPGALERFLASDARFLVTTTWLGAPEELARMVASLPVGRTLVIPSLRRRLLPELLEDVIGPRELALTPREAAEVWRREGGAELAPEQLADLLTATDGWFEPLRLAARAAAPPPSPEALVARPEVGEFLESRVLGDRSASERRSILRASGERLAASGWPFLTHPEPRWPAPLAAWCSRQAGTVATERGAQVELHLLGATSARIRRSAEEIWREGHWPLKNAFRALAFLATSPGRSATREELVEAVFPRSTEEWLGRNFHPTLSHLRRGLGLGDRVSPLELRDGRYGLAREIAWWIDVETHGEHAARGREAAALGRYEDAVAAWREVWRLYRGPLLDGWYEPWAEERRAAAAQIHQAVLRDLAAALVRLGRDEEALDAFRAALVEDPLEERLHLELLRLYGRLGRRDLVRRQYERLTTQLREELGVEPERATTAAYHRLMVERSG